MEKAISSGLAIRVSFDLSGGRALQLLKAWQPTCRGTEFACNDNGPCDGLNGGVGRDSTVTIPLSMGESVLIRVSYVGGVIADGSFVLNTACEEFVPMFRRGDCNDDGVYDIADVISNLSNLSQLFPPPGTTPAVPTCLDACDGNDDGVVDVAEPVAQLSELFAASGMTVPLPSPGSTRCGVDPTLDSLDCAVTTVCP